MNNASFDRMASVTASTKRSTAGAAPAQNLINLKIVPLMPADERVIERYRLKSPRQPFVTFTRGAPDIVHSDILVVAGVDYPVVGVGPWATDAAFYELVVERVK